MENISLHQALTIYIWFGLGAFVFFLALIARFYERLSGEKTYYRWSVFPVVMFAGAAVRFASLDQITGDVVGDGFLFIGGLSLALLCWHVYQLMTSGR